MDPFATQPSPQVDDLLAITRADEQKDPSEPVRQFIKTWQGRINAARKHHGDAFKQMRNNRHFVRYGCDSTWKKSGKYRANIVLRHVIRKAADLYARNPRALAKRRPKLDYRIWDGTPESLQMAMMAVQSGMMDPMAMALLQEVQMARQHQMMLDRVARTLELLFHLSLAQQQPNFKVQAKSAVRRSVIDGVAYCKLDVYREFGPSALLHDAAAWPTNAPGVMRSELDHSEEEKDDASALAASLAQQTTSRHAARIADREGLLYLFPAGDEIIVDPKCRCLRSLDGAEWIAHEVLRTPEQVREIYGVDLGKKYTAYRGDETRPGLARFESESDPDNPEKIDGAVLIWEVQDKRTGMFFTICDGYPDFLSDPQPPAIALDRFFTVFALIFNEAEFEGNLYPPSDVELLSDSQEEYNRARHGLREHRQASRPRYVAVAGKFEETEKALIASCPPHALVEAKGLTPGEAVNAIIQPFPAIGIDPNLYETASILDDTMRTTGSQEANIGGTSGVTATETQIAEGSRVSSIQSNIDDLDEWLSDIAEAAGEALLQNLSVETVQRMAGPGAVWPQWTASEVASQIYLEIKAGSAGRPNRAAELANLERAGPLLLQVPGISPSWFARQIVNRLDDSLDINEALVEGLPSMVALNAMIGRGGPAEGGMPQPDNPNQTTNGTEGAVNSPDAQQGQPGAQGGFPAGPMGVVAA